MFEKNISSIKKIRINRGGTRCFGADTLVYTTTGLKKISQINIGDEVLTPNGSKMVEDLFISKNTKRCLKIKLKNGKEIIVTEDHKFMFRNKWTEIKNIIYETSIKF